MAGSGPSQRSAISVAMAGLEMGLVIVVLTLVGRWLDGRFATRPWLTLIGLAMGLIGGTYNVWKIGRSSFDD